MLVKWRADKTEGQGKALGAKARAPFSFLRACALGGLRLFHSRATPAITLRSGVPRRAQARQTFRRRGRVPRENAPPTI
jgi:hypothetical protein